MRWFFFLLPPALLLSACAEDEPTSPVAVSEAVEAYSSRTPTITTVLSGLDAPRGLAWGPEGGLYVAEAGTAAVNGPCVTVARGQNCYSGTGAVTRWWRGKQERVATGLPSTFVPAQQDIVGPQDIAFVGRRAFVSIGWGGDPEVRAQLGRLAKGFGFVIRLRPNGRWREDSDIAGVEGAENPAGGPIDANPFGMYAERERKFVADAGGNSLLRVSPNGRAKVIAIFPPTPAPPPFGQSDAVPTEVERGPGGGLFVSTLSGAPFLIGAAKIYRVRPFQAPTVYADGFKTVTDFTFGPDGSLYVLEFASAPVFFGGPGRVVRVARNGTRTLITSEKIVSPTAILVDRDGVIYLSNRGNLPGVGEVLRIRP